MTLGNDSIFFEATTKGLRKPRIRMRSKCGRNVELLAFHIEPAFCVGPPAKPVFNDVAKRIYPNSRTVWVGSPVDGDCFVCLAHFCSGSTAGDSETANCSYLLVGSFLTDIEGGICKLALNLLNSVME